MRKMLVLDFIITKENLDHIGNFFQSKANIESGIDAEGQEVVNIFYNLEDEKTVREYLEKFYAVGFSNQEIQSIIDSARFI